MATTPAVRAGAATRSPMAHRAPRAARRPLAAVGRMLPAPVAVAVAEEASELTRLGRTLLPRRKSLTLVGLALLVLLAAGGIAGAAEPQTARRSALEAFSASAAPAATIAADAAGAAASSPVVQASAAPATAPAAIADSPEFKGPDLFDLATKTLLVLALLFVTLRVLRRVQGASPGKGSGLVSVLETRSLGSKAQVHLVAIGDRRLVIGQSPSGLVSLGELDAAELPVDEPVREPWSRGSALDRDPELESQVAHELANGRRSRLGVSA